jgi:hypothetical protein
MCEVAVAATTSPINKAGPFQIANKLTQLSWQLFLFVVSN